MAGVQVGLRQSIWRVRRHVLVRVRQRRRPPIVRIKGFVR